ncbi:glycosyltransferase family 2 protein [bacterium]|nr:glycosyltransferase family 2 protein [bacterium]
MTSCRLSIIIPVYDRIDRLRTCLETLGRQEFDAPAEVIVACDGGPPEMRSTAEEWKGPWSLEWLQTDKGGPARARNAAVEIAKGEVILFLNDDVRLEPGFLQVHDRRHREDPGHAVFGNSRWAPEVIINDFMHWVAHHDSFYYLIPPNGEADWVYFHTLNASIHRKWFDEGHLFDVNFPYPAYEDNEYAYRLQKIGLRILYAADAFLYHHHLFEPKQYSAKSWERGASARCFVEKYPELRDMILGEYLGVAERMRYRLRISDALRRPDGPDEWHARFAMAYLAGYRDEPIPKLAMRFRD